MEQRCVVFRRIYVAGRVILTTDKINTAKSRGEGFFERTGYVAVYAIDDFRVDDEGMRFRFTDRIANAN
jgi:hypothetical protein